jgi:hypothetical protein
MTAPAKNRWRRTASVAVGVLLVLSLAALTPHHWVPPAVDALRWAVGFGPVSRLQRVVFDALDDKSPGGQERAVKLLWGPPPGCVDAGVGFDVARAAVDVERPDVQTTFVRMDLSRLRLGLRNGGVAPDTAVAAFNGAFQIDHGRFGLRAQGATVVPAVPGAATLAVDANGDVRLWTWGESDLDTDWQDLRQNLQLLLDQDREPAVLTEMTLVADGRTERIGAAPTRRSGVCLTDRALVYVWSRRATAATLGRAMEVAGCRTGLHLDANAFQTRFEFLGPGCAQIAAPAMTDGPAGRYRKHQKREFFVVGKRE